MSCRLVSRLGETVKRELTGPCYSLCARTVTDQEVVWFNIGVDNPGAMEELHQSQQLTHQMECQRLNDLFIRRLGEIDKVEESAL